MNLIKPLIFSIFFSLCLSSSAQANDLVSTELNSVKDKTQEIDTFIENVLAKSKVPGLALVIIENKKPVYVKGQGFKEIGKQEPVDADTVFGIGSITKSMTTMLLAKKIDEELFLGIRQHKYYILNLLLWIKKEPKLLLLKTWQAMAQDIKVHSDITNIRQKTSRKII